MSPLRMFATKTIVGGLKGGGMGEREPKGLGPRSLTVRLGIIADVLEGCRVEILHQVGESEASERLAVVRWWLLEMVNEVRADYRSATESIDGWA